MHHDSLLTPQTPLPVAISNTQSEKEANICQYSLDNRKIRKQYERKNSGVLTISGNMVSVFISLWGSSPVQRRRSTDGQTGHRHFLFLPRFYQVKNLGLLFWLRYFYSHLSCWSYLQNGSREWRGLEVSWNPARWIFFGRGWLIAALFGPVQKNSGVGVLESTLPLGNKTTTHTFSDASYTHVHFSCVRFQQTGTDYV